MPIDQPDMQEALKAAGFTERIPGSEEDKELNDQGIFALRDPRHPDYQWFELHPLGGPDPVQYDPVEARRLHISAVGPGCTCIDCRRFRGDLPE